jgi:hypothetical protein
LRTYDRAKGAADRELAGDAAIARQKEMQAAQGQFGDALSAQLDRESRERQSKYGHDATTSRKQMELKNTKEGAERTAWLEAAAGAWKMFGGDIASWMRDGWSKKAAKDAIDSQGGKVSAGSGDDSDSIPSVPLPTLPGDLSNTDVADKTNAAQDDLGQYQWDEGEQLWVWKYWHEMAGGGSVDGPGTETSDDIPALLSDGEFVIKASAVKGLGRSKGAKNDEEARDKGIELLYELQNKYGDLEEYSHGGAAFGDVLAERRLLDRNRVRGGRNV